MAKISDMRFLVQPDVMDCPSFLIDKALLKAARELTERTEIWRYTLPVATSIGNTSYPLNVAAANTDAVFARIADIYPAGENTELDRVTDLRDLRTLRTGKPRAYGCNDGAYLHIAPIPDAIYSIDVNCILRLRLTDPAGPVDVPAHVYDQAAEIIAYGAVGELLIESGNPWSNPQLGAAKKILFEEGVVNLAAQVKGLFAKAETRARAPTCWAPK